MNSQQSSIVFRKRNKTMDWKKIEDVNLIEIESGSNLESLQKNLSNITFCNIEAEMMDSKPKNFLKAFIIGQYIIEYLMYCQENSEKKIAHLNREMDAKTRTILSMAQILSDKETQVQNLKMNKKEPDSFVFKELHSDVASLTKLNMNLLQTIDVLIKEINMLTQLMTEQRSGRSKGAQKPNETDSQSDNDSNTFTVKHVAGNIENVFEEVSCTSTETPYDDQTIAETSSKWDEEEFSLKHLIAKATEASFHFSRFGINFEDNVTENFSEDAAGEQIQSKKYDPDNRFASTKDVPNDQIPNKKDDVDNLIQSNNVNEEDADLDTELFSDRQELQDDSGKIENNFKDDSEKVPTEFLDSDNRSDSSGSFLELAQNEEFSDSSLKSPDVIVAEPKFETEQSTSTPNQSNNLYEIPRPRRLSEPKIQNEANDFNKIVVTADVYQEPGIS